MEIWSDDLEESETTTPTFCFLSHTPLAELAWGKVEKSTRRNLGEIMWMTTSKFSRRKFFLKTTSYNLQKRKSVNGNHGYKFPELSVFYSLSFLVVVTISRLKYEYICVTFLFGLEQYGIMPLASLGRPGR